MSRLTIEDELRLLEAAVAAEAPEPEVPRKRVPLIDHTTIDKRGLSEKLGELEEALKQRKADLLARGKAALRSREREESKECFAKKKLVDPFLELVRSHKSSIQSRFIWKEVERRVGLARRSYSILRTLRIGLDEILPEFTPDPAIDEMLCQVIRAVASVSDVSDLSSLDAAIRVAERPKAEARLAELAHDIDPGGEGTLVRFSGGSLEHRRIFLHHDEFCREEGRRFRDAPSGLGVRIRAGTTVDEVKEMLMKEEGERKLVAAGGYAYDALVDVTIRRSGEGEGAAKIGPGSAKFVEDCGVVENELFTVKFHTERRVYDFHQQ